ncbi:MAG: tryptophan-rich sensory protein [Acetobacteraceae bacterium]|nr:tryptophan-rich sensory protein [Acetobacteraceae bacterium]
MVATGILGGAAVQLGPWYASLRKPDWMPNEMLIGPAWGAIFLLSAWAFVTAWRGGAPRGLLLLTYVVNGALNAGWTWLFFQARRPDWSLLEAAPLLLSILAMIAVCAQGSRAAAWLNLPYLAWVGFAAALNLAIMRLNGPFG